MRAWLIVVLLTGVAMIGVSFWTQRISDDNTASSSPDLRLPPPPPSTWMLGVYAAILLVGVGFFVLQLVLFLRSHYRQTHTSSGSRDASS
jgi:TRAP-type C4-dicarboxylate transport system permease small subunit